jgi:dTDP-4-amino-4,6-dideoxygalactose transaminase
MTQSDNAKALPYARHAITVEDIAAVGRALADDVITRGPGVEQFEKALAAYCGARYAVLFNSGSTGLEAACHAAALTPFDRVLTSPNTFVATATAVIRQGGTPTFVDVDPATGNLDLAALASHMCKPATRGRTVVLPVHYAGVTVNMRELDRLIQDPDAVVIEDAAAALGSAYDAEHRVGSCRWSQMTIFSFHPAKIITTGEGGAVTTNDAQLFHRLVRFRNNGIERDAQHQKHPDNSPWYYEVHETTGNYNFTDFQAALGLSQLQRLDQLISKRLQIVAWYRDRLQQLSPVDFVLRETDARIAPQLFVLLIDYERCHTTRAEVMRTLGQARIGTQVHYLPLYRHPYFEQRAGDLTADFPGMEAFYAKALTLPLFHELEEEDVDYICAALKKCLGQT